MGLLIDQMYKVWENQILLTGGIFAIYVLIRSKGSEL